MTDFFAREPDPLEDLLAPPPAAAAEPLRERLLSQTTQMLRRRRRLRRLSWAAALAAGCAVALLGVWRLARPAPPGPSLARQERPAPQPAPELPDTAVAAEERAADDDDLRAQAALYRRAGELYLGADNDPAAALRCYGNALDAGGEESLPVSPSDDWLLMAIKNARQKEKRHANNGG